MICRICSKEVSRRNLMRHLRERHSKGKLAKCPEKGCKYQSVRIDDVRRHQLRAHKLSVQVTFDSGDESTSPAAAAPAQEAALQQTAAACQGVAGKEEEQRGKLHSPPAAAPSQEAAPPQPAAASSRRVPDAAMIEKQGPSDNQEVELIIDASEDLTLSEVPEEDLPAKEVKLSRHADVRREQQKLNFAKTGEDFDNPSLEAALADCLNSKGGKEWLEAKLFKLGKLHLLTPDQLRGEKLQARQRGREAALQSKPSSLKAARTGLRNLSLEPERIGVRQPAEFQDLPNLVQVGDQLYSLSVKFEPATVTPTPSDSSFSPLELPTPSPVAVSASREAERVSTLPQKQKPAAAKAKPPRRKRARIYKTPEFVNISSDSSDCSD